MAGSNQYRDYIKRSFLRFAFSIIALLFVLVGLFLFINVQLISAGGNRKNNARLGAVLDKQVKAYEEGLLRFGSDYRILEALKDRDSGRVTEVNRLLYDFSNAQSIRCSFVLTDSGGEIVSSNLFEGNREIFLNSTVFQSMFEKMAAEPDKIFTMPSRLNYAHGQAGDLALARAVSGPDRVYGYLFFDLSDEQIYTAVRDYPLDDVILTDRYDNLIFSIGRQSADPMEKYPAGKYRMEWQKGNVVKVNGKHYHVQKELLPESTLVLYTLVSMEFQRTLVSYGMIFLLIVGVLMLIMITPLSLRIAGKNLEAIDELQNAVAEMGRGNMDYRLQGQVFDEFKELGDAFFSMVTQREELMLHNSELTERKRIMEIKQLEEQFNPHFIFNVQTDIEYLNDYLLLQKMRYNRSLNYHIDIPEELMGCKIPKLLLQPVVENSLVHGMKDIRSIAINISAWKEKGQLKLCVEDNGSGIREEKLEELRKGLEREDVYREHIGLYNSHRVVRLLYGPESGMTIESSPGNGTKVTVTLPADMEEI